MKKANSMMMRALSYVACVCVGVAMAMVDVDALSGTTPGFWLGFAWFLIGVVVVFFSVERHRAKRPVEATPTDTADTL